MKSRIEIQAELAELASSLPPQMPGSAYAVPEGYFEGLPGAVLNRIKASEDSASAETEALSPLLAGIGRAMPFSVPRDYFESAAETLPALLGEDTLPAVLRAEKTNPYEIPAGYFDALPAIVLARVPRPRAKVVPMVRLMRVAVAAVLIGLVALSGYLMLSGGKGDVSVDNPQWVARELKGVSNETLQQFIQTTEIQTDTYGTASAGRASVPDVKNMLRDVTDRELDAFLAEVPADEELLVIN